jgi:malate synthase
MRKWVAHPGLIDDVRRVMTAPELVGGQLLDDTEVSMIDLLAVPDGDITEEEVRAIVSDNLEYTSALLNGRGCVPVQGLMQDVATAEITLALLRQWLEHGEADIEFVYWLIKEEWEKLYKQGKADDEACKILYRLALIEDRKEYLSVEVYTEILKRPNVDYGALA